MPLKFAWSRLLPDLKIRVIIPLHHELGKEPLRSTRLNNLKRATFKTFTPVIHISLRVLSGPGAFLGFSLLFVLN